MALPAVAGATILAADLYQLCQPSGGQETGRYWLAGWGSAASDAISFYVCSQSRNATPVSVSIDTTDQAPTSHLNAPSAVHLTNGGFQVSSSTTAASTAEFCGGHYTIQY